MQVRKVVICGVYIGVGSHKGDCLHCLSTNGVAIWFGFVRVGLLVFSPLAFLPC